MRWNFQRNFLPKLLVMRFGSGSGCNKFWIRPDPGGEPLPFHSTDLMRLSLLNYSWESVTFWCGSGSPDPYLWLMDPDRTPSFIDFKDAKKILFPITCPQALHLQSKKFHVLLKFCVKILFCRHYRTVFKRKGKDPEPDSCPDPYLWLMDPNRIRKAQKTFGSESGSTTLLAWLRRRRGSQAEPVPRGADPSSARPPAFAPQLLGSVCLKKPKILMNR